VSRKTRNRAERCQGCTGTPVSAFNRNYTTGIICPCVHRLSTMCSPPEAAGGALAFLELVALAGAPQPVQESSPDRTWALRSSGCSSETDEPKYSRSSTVTGIPKPRSAIQSSTTRRRALRSVASLTVSAAYGKARASPPMPVSVTTLGEPRTAMPARTAVTGKNHPDSDRPAVGGEPNPVSRCAGRGSRRPHRL
jgi:hypothetical protein